MRPSTTAPGPRTCRRRGGAGPRLWGCLVLIALGLGGFPPAPGLPPGVRTAEASLGDRALNLVKTLRTEKSAAARKQAAADLGRLADTEAMSALVAALFGDADADVRAACAEALGQLADPSARSALRAAQRDESPRVRKAAEASIVKLSGGDAGAAGPQRRLTVVVGRTGSKVKSGTLDDIPKRLRDALLSEMKVAPAVDLIDEPRGEETVKPSGQAFSVEGSVVKLARRTTPSGELEISCDVSLIVSKLPGRSIISMLSGGASVFGPRGPSTKPTKAFIENLETQALTQAVSEANASLLSFLRNLSRAPQ